MLAVRVVLAVLAALAAAARPVAEARVRPRAALLALLLITASATEVRADGGLQPCECDRECWGGQGCVVSPNGCFTECRPFSRPSLPCADDGGFTRAFDLGCSKPDTLPIPDFGVTRDAAADASSGSSSSSGCNVAGDVAGRTMLLPLGLWLLFIFALRRRRA
ncbi:MAG: hypothetical protein KC503_05510 [Myxococcales bacterium]|nr:hypothetical protein [Myxococcales bacterium]